MKRHQTFLMGALAAAWLGWSALARAGLPPPTPAQAQAAAAKKAAADAQATKDKEKLAASMEAIAQRWRSRAASQGWRTNAPVAIAAAPAPASAPAGASAGAAAAAASPAAPGTGGPAGQPSGQLSPTVAQAPIRSEKLGTAPPSEDVKQRPTPTVKGGPPANASEYRTQPTRKKE